MKVNISKQAEKFLRSLDAKPRGQIIRKIMGFAEGVFPTDVKKIKGSDYLRMSAGEYRIVFMVQDDEMSIGVIGKRNDGEIYELLKRKGSSFH